jgi:tellurite resistance protein TerC
VAHYGVLAAAAAGFAAWLGITAGRQTALEFVGGWAIETSLSVDNLFIFLVIFQGFRISTRRQHTALLWGVLGAVLLRGLFIFAGISLLKRFEWITWVFGLFLLYRSRCGWCAEAQPKRRFPSGFANCSRPGGRSCR